MKEWHPAKDAGGNQLYPFKTELLQEDKQGKPQCIDLLEVLEVVDTEDGKKRFIGKTADGNVWRRPTDGVLHKIRAVQGHSGRAFNMMKEEDAYTRIDSEDNLPAVLLHGTSKTNDREEQGGSTAWIEKN